jgi:hypothetical protein
MFAGCAVKALGVLIYHLMPNPLLLKVLLAYDPLATRFGDTVLPLFFHRGLAPAGESTVYELLLIMAFAGECFVLGLMTSEVRRLVKARCHVQ